MAGNITSIITGDIVNSRSINNQQSWLRPLKQLFNKWGETPKTWEIYRGDSFQIEIDKPEEALKEVIKIKAAIKQISSIDVRISIGLGNKKYNAQKITESNGTAFINSGETFDALQKTKRNIAIKTTWRSLNEEMEAMLGFASLYMDNWTPVTAKIVEVSINNTDKTQTEIAKIIGKKSQSDISEGRIRAAYDQIMVMEKFYRNRVLKHLKK
jgi:hypothetical protein